MRLTFKTLDELHHAILEVKQIPEARALLLTGAGVKAFVAGADILEMKDFSGVEAQAFSQKGMNLFP